MRPKLLKDNEKPLKHQKILKKKPVFDGFFDAIIGAHFDVFLESFTDVFIDVNLEVNFDVYTDDVVTVGK